MNRTENQPRPFSLRLTQDERSQLQYEAGDAPLGAYMRQKLLSDVKPRKIQNRKTVAPDKDLETLAQILALLGRSQLVANLNELAYAASIGALALDPDTLADLRAAIREVREFRTMLIAALGLKPEGAAPCS